MVDLTVQDKLQPSLLDRLTDTNPGKSAESRDERVLSQHELRQAVLRDLTWLLNTSSIESIVDLDDYTQVKTSVLNYGTPDFAGQTKSSVDHYSLEKKIRKIIENYEPRIIRNSINIQFVNEGAEHSGNTVYFEIKASVWGQPMPQELYLRTELDLELGEISVLDE